MGRATLLLLAPVFALPLACGAASDLVDAGGVDAGAADASSLDAAPTDSGSEDSGSSDAAPLGDAGPHFLTTLDAPEDLAGLLAPGGDVKYLSPVVGAELRPPIVEPCYFQNMQLYPYHLLFLRSFPELATLGSNDYANLVLRRPTRIWWGGGVKLYPDVAHPIAGRGVLAWTVYHEVAGADRLVADDVVAVHERLASCARFAPELLAFLPTDPYQSTLAHAEQAALAARGVAVIFPDQLR